MNGKHWVHTGYVWVYTEYALGTSTYILFGARTLTVSRYYIHVQKQSIWADFSFFFNLHMVQDAQNE